MRDARTWLVLVVAVGGVVGCSGQHLNTVGDSDEGGRAGAGGRFSAGSGGRDYGDDTGGTTEYDGTAGYAGDYVYGGSAGYAGDYVYGGSAGNGGYYETAGTSGSGGDWTYGGTGGSGGYYETAGTAGTGGTPWVFDPANCNDGRLSPLEADIDCGGGCRACPPASTCYVHTDCLSGVCRSGACQSATCEDGVSNGKEVGVDCGGPCEACPATCSNEKKDAGETDVDCGGLTCTPCADGKKCQFYSDCAGKHCDDKICTAP